MQIDIKKGRAPRRFGHHMRIPYLLE